MTVPKIWKTEELEAGFRVRLPVHEEGYEDRHTVVNLYDVNLGLGQEMIAGVELRNDRTGREDMHLVAFDFEWVEFCS